MEEKQRAERDWRVVERRNLEDRGANTGNGWQIWLFAVFDDRSDARSPEKGAIGFQPLLPCEIIIRSTIMRSKRGWSRVFQACQVL